MEYVYAAAILHELDQEINEANVTAVLESAGADVSESRVKALIAALEGVDLDRIVGAAQPALPDDGTEAAVEGGPEPAEGAETEGESDLPEPTEEETEESDSNLDNLFSGEDGDGGDGNGDGDEG